LGADTEALILTTELVGKEDAKRLDSVVRIKNSILYISFLCDVKKF